MQLKFSKMGNIQKKKKRKREMDVIIIIKKKIEEMNAGTQGRRSKKC